MVIKIKTSNLWLEVLQSVIASSHGCAADIYKVFALKQAVKITSNYNVEKKIFFQAAIITESDCLKALAACWPTLISPSNLFSLQHDQLPEVAKIDCVLDAKF